MKKLVKQYKELLQEVINPDDLTWDDLGFDEPLDEFNDVNDYLENGDESEFDEGQQTKIQIYHKIIDDLENRISDIDKTVQKSIQNWQSKNIPNRIFQDERRK